MTATRDDLVERIEGALIDWKAVARPSELAELAELLLDAKEAKTDEELRALDAQFRGLEAFIASRKTSSAGFVSPKKV